MFYLSKEIDNTFALMSLVDQECEKRSNDETYMVTKNGKWYAEQELLFDVVSKTAISGNKDWIWKMLINILKKKFYKCVQFDRLRK